MSDSPACESWRVDHHRSRIRVGKEVRMTLVLMIFFVLSLFAVQAMEAKLLRKQQGGVRFPGAAP